MMEIEIDWDRYPHFGRHEFVCKCGCDLAPMSTGILRRLEVLRHECGGGPLTIASGFRCNKSNRKIGGGPAHPTGRAVDIRAVGELARKLVVYSSAFTGVGVSQSGPHDARFIHLDTLDHDEFDSTPRPWIWSY